MATLLNSLAELVTSAILNDEKFKSGENLTTERLDELFRNMRWFSANRNLTNLLYRTNGLEKFNSQLRTLIHGTQPFPERVDSECFHLRRALDYLRDYLIFQAIKNLLGLEKYNFVNNLLWFAAIQDEAGGSVVGRTSNLIL